MRQEVFSLPEGTVAIEWPGDLSPESFQDLSDWLDILKRKIGRAAKQRVEAAKVTDKLKTDKGQFDEVLRRMLAREPQKTSEIKPLKPLTSGRRAAV